MLLNAHNMSEWLHNIGGAIEGICMKVILFVSGLEIFVSVSLGQLNNAITTI